MIKVGLVTTWAPERCGHFCYAQELIGHVKDPDIQFEIIQRPFAADIITGEAIKRGCNIFHLNHAWQLFGDLQPRHITHLREAGIKTVCTWHESTYDNRNEITNAFDRVVVHDPATVDGFTYVPDGIWHQPLPAYEHGPFSKYIGMVGFPFGYKNYEAASMAAQRQGFRLLCFMPESQHVAVDPVSRAVLHNNPQSVVRTDFATQLEIITFFSQCAMTLFPYAHAGSGIGGSVRLGIAARRPVIITNVVRFADLMAGYKDEFYVIPNPYPDANDIEQAIAAVVADIQQGTARTPSRVQQDMSWQNAAAKYVQLYRELVNGQA